MSFAGFFITVWQYIALFFFQFWQLFLAWLSIFAAPSKDIEILWIIIPIYLNWIFTEIYQEKRITSFGNAISNGVVVLWVGIDWTRYLFRLIDNKRIFFGFDFYSKLALSILVFIYGITIIIYGMRGRRFVHFFGRIREISYILIMFSPIIYGIIKLTWYNLLAIVIFFPIFYLLIEYINYKVPDPKTYENDEE